MVLLPEITANDALLVAEKLRATIAVSPVYFDGQEISITTSIGMSIKQPEHSSYENLLKEADEALYISKENGRNMVTIYKTT